MHFLPHVLCDKEVDALLERDFQAKLIREIKKLFPGCIVLKLDANYIQGIPALLILYGDRWAALECKRSASARRRPNQGYYIEQMNGMSYASFIEPDNKERVLHELQHALRA